MKKILAYLSACFFPPSSLMANAAEPDDFTLPILGQPEVIEEAAANEQAEVWLKLADYGDWPHPMGLQKFNQAAAQKMANAFNSGFAAFKRKFIGVPIFIGHPDDPLFANQTGHEDTRAYAWVQKLEARADGLWLLPKWSTAGNELIKSGHFRFFSPRWQLRPLGSGSFEPVKLISVGLTNHPNIPGDAVANQNPNHPAMKEEQLQQLRKLYQLPDNATADQVLAAANTAANELAAEKAKHAETETARQAAVAAQGVADTAAANARRHAATATVDLAIKDGRIALAAREAEIATLAGAPDMVAAANALQARAVVIKTVSVTRNLARAKNPAAADSQARQKTLVAAANARMKTTGEDYASAFVAVLNDPAHKAVVDAMHAPKNAESAEG